MDGDSFDEVLMMDHVMTDPWPGGQSSNSHDETMNRKRTVSGTTESSHGSPSKRSCLDSPTKRQDLNSSQETTTPQVSIRSSEDSPDMKRKTEERRLMALISQFSSDHLNRFEMYRRAALPKAGVRRLMQGAVDSSIPQNAVIAMCGIAKVFVGEIIEEALDFKERLGDEGPLQPKHIREAVRRLRISGSTSDHHPKFRAV